MTLNYQAMPAAHNQARQIIHDYIEYGNPLDQGDFFYELVNNDLAGVFRYGDAHNLDKLQFWMNWFYNEAPFDCWGSKERYVHWVQKGGLRGSFDANQELKKLNLEGS